MKKNIFLLISFFALNIPAAPIKLTISKKNCDDFQKNITNCRAGLKCYFEANLNGMTIQATFKVSKLDSKKLCSVIYTEKTSKVTNVVLFSYNSFELVDLKKVLKEYNSPPSEKVITPQAKKCCTEKGAKSKQICKLKIGNKEFKNVFDSDGYYECGTGNLIFPLKRKQFKATN